MMRRGSKPGEPINPLPPSSSEEVIHMSYTERVQVFQDALKGKISFENVASLAFGGIPDHPGLRSLYWKILLSYLPNDRGLWEETLHAKRGLYKEFISELSVDPHKAPKEDDHPLNTSNESQWNAFFKDRDLIDEVDKDVKRTLPHLHFFNHDSSVGSTEHYEALKRILFVYAKLNPGIRYVQGMNEILGPLYYIFATDPISDFQQNAEADTFFCFTNLMSEIRDNFCKTLDKSAMGIQGQMNRLNMLLKEKDPELWQDFEDKKINPQFYSFRWLTLLLSQEFDLPDVLRLWDSLFADPARFEFLLYVCVAMLVYIRETLLDGNFADNLKTVQRYPIQDIRVILAMADKIKSPSYQPPPPRPKPVIEKPVQRPVSPSKLARPKPTVKQPIKQLEDLSPQGSRNADKNPISNNNNHKSEHKDLDQKKTIESEDEEVTVFAITDEDVHSKKSHPLE